jgi:hypothetical protein
MLQRAKCSCAWRCLCCGGTRLCRSTPRRLHGSDA